MRQIEFERRNEERWGRFERALARVERAGADGLVRERLPAALADLPDQYAAICRDLSLARARAYSPRLIERLNTLALSGHSLMYARQTDLFGGAIRYLARTFPRAVRAEGASVALATLAFAGPALAIFVAVLQQPDLVYSVFSWEHVAEFEAMYDPGAEHIGTDRQASSDVAMFGYYVSNNVGVAFRCFAVGVFAGIGSIVMLAYNGLVIGGIAAHLTHIGFESTFFPFVVGHGSFELTAIVLSGAAGMRIGFAWIAPGPRPRVAAVRLAATAAMDLVYGVIVMLLVAAALEAFWSSKASVPAEAKMAVGAVLWACVLGYLAFVGRRDRDRRDGGARGS